MSTSSERRGGEPTPAAALRALAQQLGEEALHKIAAVMRNDKATHATQLRAAGMLLERGYGKPTPEEKAAFNALAQRMVDAPPKETREEWFARRGLLDPALLPPGSVGAAAGPAAAGDRTGLAAGTALRGRGGGWEV